MLSAYFTRKSVLIAFYDGAAGHYLDNFTDWLSVQGYQRGTIRRSVRGAIKFATLIEPLGTRLEELTATQLIEVIQLQSKQLCKEVKGYRLFLNYLQNQGIIPTLIEPKEAPFEPLLVEFEEWMLIHRGVTHSTLIGYRHYINDLILEFNGKPKLLSAKKLRDLITKRAENCCIATTKCRINAIRMFIKFLISNGYCKSDLNDAIPAVAHWKLSSLPKYIQPEEIERVIACCSCSSALEKRNKAIILLLARLGMRAGEIAGLQLNDIDWENSSLTVMGKNRCEAKLPIPQDVGDALHDYISTARPAINNSNIFITNQAPLLSITRYAVKHVAAKAIRKAGIDAPSFGSHVLRHSVATALLRHGTSLHAISELLRHTSIETTAHYAKVDTTLLLEIVLPWPGEI